MTVYKEAEKEVAAREWELNALFGMQRKTANDLKFLESVADGFDGSEMYQDGFDIRKEEPRTNSKYIPKNFLGVTLRGEDWKDYDAEWKFLSDVRPTEWEVTCVVTLGFIGKGPLQGYTEIRKMKAATILKLKKQTAPLEGVAGQSSNEGK